MWWSSQHCYQRLQQRLNDGDITVQSLLDNDAVGRAKQAEHRNKSKRKREEQMLHMKAIES